MSVSSSTSVRRRIRFTPAVCAVASCWTLRSLVRIQQLGTSESIRRSKWAAAALLHSLVHDHPFHNGNKRTALVSMLSLLDKNGMMLTCPEDGLFKLVVQLAKHSLTTGPRAELPDREVLSVATWLHGWVRRIKKGDRPLAWRRLKQILVRYDCELSIPGGGGNRINITRHVLRQGRLFRPAPDGHLTHTGRLHE